jgi:hypothetical protein
MKTYPILLMTVFILTSSGWTRAQGNLVVNGGFDIDDGGWSVNSGSGYFNFKNGNPPGEFVLAGVPSPSSDPTISQTVTGLVPSQTYVVSGDYINIDSLSGLPADLSFGVALDGVFLFETAQPQDFEWHHFSFPYNATAPSAVLSLSAQRNGTSIQYAIDNIAIQVPEPCSVGLLCLGVAAWAVLVEKRSKC